MNIRNRYRYIKIPDEKTDIDILDYIDDIFNFIVDNEAHEQISSLFDDNGYIIDNKPDISKAISDYEYCHNDKDRLIEEIKQLVEYDKYKYKRIV